MRDRIQLPELLGHSNHPHRVCVAFLGLRLGSTGMKLAIPNFLGDVFGNSHSSANFLAKHFPNATTSSAIRLDVRGALAAHSVQPISVSTSSSISTTTWGAAPAITGAVQRHKIFWYSSDPWHGDAAIGNAQCHRDARHCDASDQYNRLIAGCIA